MQINSDVLLLLTGMDVYSVALSVILQGQVMLIGLAHRGNFPMTVTPY